MAERMVTAIGLMRRPATEGVDVALIVTDGEARVERRQSLTFPYAPEDASQEEPGGDFAAFCAGAVRRLLETLAIARDTVGLIGFEVRGTGVEEGGEKIALATGIDVVCDFGAADREAGGKGRPLEPVYHRALAYAAGLPRPLAIIELGEEGRVVFIDEDGSLSVFAAQPSAETIVALRATLPTEPLSWLLAGERGASLLEALASSLPEPVHLASEMGWPGDHFEAEAFAYLAVRSLKRLPLTFPGTTGVRQALTGGRLVRAPRR